MAFCLPSVQFHYFGFAKCKILSLSCLIWWSSNSEGLLKVTGQWLNVILLLLHWIIYFFFIDLQYSGSLTTDRQRATTAFLSGSFNIYTLVSLTVSSGTTLPLFTFAASSLPAPNTAVDLLDWSRTEHEIIELCYLVVTALWSRTDTTVSQKEPPDFGSLTMCDSPDPDLKLLLGIFIKVWLALINKKLSKLTF